MSSWMTNEDVDFLMENCSEIFSFSDSIYTAEGTLKDIQATMHKSTLSKDLIKVYKSAIRKMKSGLFDDAIMDFQKSIELADRLRYYVSDIKEPKTKQEIKDNAVENFKTECKDLLIQIIPIIGDIYSKRYFSPHVRLVDSNGQVHDDKLSKMTNDKYKKYCLRALNLFKVKCEDNIKLCKQGISCPTSR